MNSPQIHTQNAIERIVRKDWGQILAILVKHIGDIQLAEDCLQDAMESALNHWHRSGVPRVPMAWLLQTARRKAIDRIRRTKNFESKQAEYALLIEQENNHDYEMTREAIPDERLRMIFTCCHPAIEEKARVALTLRTLGGLTTSEIALAFLDQEKAMAQRLVRAKRKIRDAGIGYEIPDREFWPDRLNSVLSVLYLIFNEGYRASSGDTPVRHDLCEEAIRLTRAISALIPQEPEITGLLALMLLHHSRSCARHDQGKLVIMQDQDRSRWSADLITEGKRLVVEALELGKPGPYQIQAAISAVHADANKHSETDWHQIALLYGQLYTMTPSHVVRLNQAVAVSYAQGVDAAIGLLGDENLVDTLAN